MSCADVQTIQAGNGVKTQFSFDFPYIFKSEIQVSFWNATTKEWDVKLTTDATYPWQVTDANPTIVEFTGTAPPAPAVPVDPNETAVDNVRIRRVTNIDDIRALFNPGSAIRSDDLNKNFEQLRYAIQESNCQGVTEDMYQYLLDNYWDRFDNTIYSADTWVSDDTKIATTEAIDQRIDSKVDDALTLDIDGSDGITITDNTPSGGQIVVGIGANSVDLDRIKDEDIITYAEQNAGSPSWDTDNRIATAYASARRFDTLVQQAIPSGTDWQVGKTWLQNDQDLTLSIWNGINWLAIASGGAFINQPKVVYVDASSGADTNDGHRISRPKKTIKAAINQINADATYGDGSVVVVAPGVYQEVAPIDILKKDVGIIGTALRSCVIHPTPATETNSLFRVNSGTFLQNLTFTGVKASGARGGNTEDPDSTYGLPPTQGWNVSFYPNATIVKSPYIQNCTNFSDSEIDNNNLDPHNPAGGSGGDIDSAVTGGGLLIDGSVVNSNSPLRSMVCDSYTHVGLDGPGILVTNNGYAQCTSSYAFFNHYHIKCLNGGQANLAASTTDFGRYGLIADGRSPNAIFTASTTVSANSGDISFTIGAPTAQAGWHGSATRPQSNMLVDIGGNTYPILEANASGAGWVVTISNPDPADRANNLGLSGAVASGSPVSFYLRSMIASSGHTMEYVGSGTNYLALPENGGVPIETNQVVELNDGKVWTATTDHNGKFKVGDFFTVDQQNSSITVASGSFQVNLNTLALNVSGNAVIGAPLDFNGNSIVDSTGTLTIEDTVDVNGNKIVNLTDPTLAQDAATKNYVDSSFVELQGDTMTGPLVLPSGSASAPSLTFSSDTNTGLYSPGADQLALSTNGTGRLFVNANGNVGVGEESVTAIYGRTVSAVGTGAATYRLSGTSTSAYFFTSDSLGYGGIYQASNHPFVFATNSVERLRITSAGLVGIGTSAPSSLLSIKANNPILTIEDSDDVGNSAINFASSLGTRATIRATSDANPRIQIETSGTPRFAVTNTGNVGIGTTSPISRLDVVNTAATSTTAQANTIARIVSNASNADANIQFSNGVDRTAKIGIVGAGNFYFALDGAERARIDSSGRLGIGTSSPSKDLHIQPSADNGGILIKGTFANRFTAYTSPDTSAGYRFGYSETVGGLIQRCDADGAFVANVMAFDSLGNVGIGTTSPSDVLHVVGGGRFTGSAVSLDVNGAFIDYSSNIARIAGCNSTGGAIAFLTNPNGGFNTERARIDSSGRLLVGTSSALAPGGITPQIQLEGTSAGNSSVVVKRNSNDAGRPIIYFAKSRGTANGSNTIVQSDDILGSLLFAGADGSDIVSLGAEISAQVDGTPGANDMPGRLVFSTTADGGFSPTERMRITSGGAFLIGKTSNTDNTTDGFIFEAGTLIATRGTDRPLIINRQTNDGSLVSFRQANTEEGTISVSGTTVSYNGAHLSRWSQFPSGAERTEILRGSVLSNIDEMCEWGDEENEQLNRMKVSDVEGDKNVSGVFQAWDDDDDIYTNDFYCAMTGDFIIRIGAGVTVERGDLLMSAGDGTAKPQDDDIIRSKTIAKVTSTNVSCTYDDGSYCVPCVLMAC